MREKFRIGDGKVIEKNSITSTHGMSSQFNDGASLMFETGQAFFNPTNNVFSGHKFQMSDTKQLPPLQLQSKTILSMQSSTNNAGGPHNPAAVMDQHNFQMQKASNNGSAMITPQKPVEKMISRDVKGNLGIVPVDTMKGVP